MQHQEWYIERERLLGRIKELEAKKKFVTKKRETASAFKQVYDDNRINVESEFLMNIHKISE